MTPRELAFRLLQKAESNDQFLNIALDHALSDSGMREVDRSLAATLVYGVTERRLTLDYQIARLSNRPVDQIDLPVRTALRLGLYQLLYLDRIPAHAAVSETVSLVSRKASGFVNALLRACTRDPRIALPDRDEDPAYYLSISRSVGLPLCQRLIDAYGAERAESILLGFEKPNRTTLSVNTLRVSRHELASKISGAEPTAMSPTGLLVRGAVRELYGFEDGLFFVQDEASQICVEALDAQPGETVMDICSCPGSKSFGSAIRMQNRGKILAYDLHAKKIPLIESGASRLGITIITPSVRDGRDFLPELAESAHRVLCDVPCSGFGVLGKKPELRYKDPAASAALPDIQLAILANACRYVRPGGTLVYSTCTVFPEENEQNVARFLASHPDFSLTPFSVGTLSVPRGYLTLLPDTHPTDGFFIAKLRRH
ncbi:MAG: 16S rRNA (cytosine(967)-C(5))-methyltransferase RsmB [Clostridia bacterium]|nr:16S rRNA (cytosine(967)-C(5))-methyltransferase RsmB [Clostridia bacterium]